MKVKIILSLILMNSTLCKAMDNGRSLRFQMKKTPFPNCMQILPRAKPIKFLVELIIKRPISEFANLTLTYKDYWGKIHEIKLDEQSDQVYDKIGDSVIFIAIDE